MDETAVKKHILESSHLDMLEKLLNGMKYGNITIAVQDGKIIQIEKTGGFAKWIYLQNLRPFVLYFTLLHDLQWGEICDAVAVGMA